MSGGARPRPVRCEASVTVKAQAAYCLSGCEANVCQEGRRNSVSTLL
jgi:hypothetical protein